MRLTSMTIKNFKNIDENGISIKFAPITLLFGPNNAGKSTIIKSLLLVREYFCTNVPDFDNISPELGTFKNYVHHHNLKNIITISLTFSDFSFLNFIYNQSSITNSNNNNINTPKINLFSEYINNFGASILDDHLLQVYGNDEIKYLTVTFSLSWDKYINRSYASNLTISFNHEEFLKINTVSNYNSQNERVFEGEVIPCTRIAKEYIAHYFNIQSQLKFNNSKLAYTFKYPDSIPLGTSGVPIWDSDYAITIEIKEKYASCNSTLLLHQINPFYSFNKSILSSCILVKSYFEGMINLGPLRAIPTNDDLTPRKITKQSKHNGLAAWTIIFDYPKEIINKINSSLDGPNSLNTGYQVLLKDYYQLDKDSALFHMLNNLSEPDPAQEDIKLLSSLVSDFKHEVPLKQVLLKNTKNNTIVRPQDMGAGIAQVLPLVILAYAPFPYNIFTVEQPELHIHPAWQVSLGDIFIQANKGFNKIFILETHSEHLLLRLLRRVNESHKYIEKLSEVGNENEIKDIINKDGLPVNYITPEHISINWIGNRDGYTTASLLEIDEEGEFTTLWPDGFFEERCEELF